MTWMAGRLIEDADPDRARRFFDGKGELEKRRKMLDQDGWLSRLALHCRAPSQSRPYP